MKTIKQLEKEIEMLFYPEIKEGKIPIMKSKNERKDIWDNIFTKGYKKCYVYSCNNDAMFTVMNDKGKPRQSYCQIHKEIINKTFRRNTAKSKEKLLELKAQLQILKEVLKEIDKRIEEYRKRFKPLLPDLVMGNLAGMVISLKELKAKLVGE